MYVALKLRKLRMIWYSTQEVNVIISFQTIAQVYFEVV